MISLPIDAYLDSIVDNVKSNSQVVLTATPGAGKTTRLPSHLLNAVSGKVAILQPRRVAALSACQFVASENGWTVGKEVGYQVRQDSKFGPNTRLLFMTDAILLRRLIDDPVLSDFDLIVIDEFHERNLNQDVILGVVKELQELGRNIKVLVMSATLELTDLQRYLSQSVVIDIPGKVFPLKLEHSQQPLSLQTDFNFIQRVSKAIISKIQEPEVKDLLVFLPGVGEIHRVQKDLIEKKISKEICVLHGSLTLDEQKKVLSPSTQPRVILSTNIAEASVTVPGVNSVIDSGLSKVLTTNLNSGFSILNLMGISKFNAVQRAGRAARQMPGQCLKLWTIHEESSKTEQMIPEIQRLDLTSTVLLLSFLGVTDPKTFSWFQSPPEALICKAQQYLIQNGALTTEGIITEKGRSLLSYPVEPRYSTLMFEAESLLLDPVLVSHCVALLQDSEILSADSLMSSNLESDLLDQLQTLEDLEDGQKFKSTPFKIRKIFESSQQLQKILKYNKNSKTEQITNTQEHYIVLLKILLKTQSDRLCRRRGTSDRGRMVGGRGVRLSSKSQVKQSEFFLALSGRDISGQPETQIEFAHGFTKTEILEILKDQIYLHEETIYDPEKGQFYLQKVRRFFDLDLEEPTLSKVSSEQMGMVWVDALVLQWSEIVKSNKSLKLWMSRWTHYDSDGSLLKPEMIRQALEMASVGINSMDELLKQDLVHYLETLLDPGIVSEFKKLTPAEFHAPSGGVHLIHYTLDEDPFVEVRLQEMFGLLQTPKLGRLQKPLVIKLLAPNFRPVQITTDIAGFWARSYVEVRKELRGRYPKHSWPEDPLTAQPVQKGRFHKKIISK